MRKHINLITKLSEAPIDSWTISPFFDKNEEEMISKFHGYDREQPHWSPTDKKALRSPEHIKRIKNVFAKNPHHFQLYFWQSTEPDYDPFLQRGAVEDDWINRVMRADAEAIKALRSSDAITIVMTNNLSDEYAIPLTSPWIVAHRVAHAIEGRSDAISHYFYGFLNKVLERGYGLEWHDGDTQYGRIINNDYEQIYGKMMGNMLGTMNSARHGKLVQASEWAHESFAQYLVTGKIEFRALPEIFDEGLELTHDPKKRAIVLKLHDAFPKFIMHYFDNLLSRSTGEIFVI